MFKRRLRRRAKFVSLGGFLVLSVVSTAWAMQNRATEANHLYTTYIEIYESGDVTELEPARASIDSILDEEIGFTAVGPCQYVTNDESNAGGRVAGVPPTADLADLAVLRGLLYLRDGSLHNAKRLNRTMETSRSHRGYALNSLGNAYLRQAEIIYNLRTAADTSSAESQAGPRERLRTFLCLPTGAALKPAADSALRLAADSAEAAYNGALRHAIDGGNDAERLRLAVQHNIFNLQARLGEMDSAEPALAPEIRIPMDEISARLDSLRNTLWFLMTQANDTAAQDTLVLLLQQVHVQEREPERDTTSGPSP